MKVFLHGKLGSKFGEEWELDISTPREAFFAIDANTDDSFKKYLFDKSKDGVGYFLFTDDSVLEKNLVDISIRHKKEIHILPAIAGSMPINTYAEKVAHNPLFQYGVYSVAAGHVFKWWADSDWAQDTGFLWFDDIYVSDALDWTGDLLIEGGTALIMTSMIDALTDEPEAPNDPAKPPDESTSSYLFRSPLNNVNQGAVVPLGYGRLRVGSHVISSALLNARRARLKSRQISSSVENEDSVLLADTTED